MQIKKPFKIILILLATPILFAVLACLFFQTSSALVQKSNPIELAPQNGRFVRFENENIFIQEAGPKSNSAIVFIHGTGSWSELWKPTIKLLSDLGFYCIAIDMPPFGFSNSDLIENVKYDRNSQAKRIVSVLDSLKIEKVTLVGHSFGGRATVTTALMIPSRVERLILVDIALGFGEQNDLSNPAPPSSSLAFTLNNSFLRNTLASIGTFPPLTRKLVEMFVADPKAVTSEINQMYQLPLGVKGKTRQMGDWLKDFLLSTDNELVQKQDLFIDFSAPTYLIWGDLDTITPLWQAEEIKTRFKSVQLHTMPKVGHIPMIEDSQGFEKIIRSIFSPSAH